MFLTVVMVEIILENFISLFEIVVGGKQISKYSMLFRGALAFQATSH
jgi:hypothetical protein